MRSKRDPEEKTDNMQAERSDIGPSFYERAIRTTIGRGLRSYYDLAEPIPEQMTKLLQQIDDSALPATKNGAAEAVQKPKDREPKPD
jgi:Anti-sigma factor NepR